MRLSKSHRVPAAVWVGVVVLDVLSKAAARRQLFSEPWPHVLIPGVLWLEFVRNPGVILGLGRDLAGLPGWLPLVQLGLVAPLYLLWQRLRADDTRARVLIAVSAAGVCGNLVGRLADGYVIDFVAVSALGHGHVAGNVADAALVLGVSALMLHVWRRPLPDRTALALARLRAPNR